MATSDPVRDRPLLRYVHESPSGLTLPPGSVFLYSTSGEERSRTVDVWMTAHDDVEFIQVQDNGDLRDPRVNFLAKEFSETVSLYDSDALREFIRQRVSESLYMDMTGMGHHVWAPLLRAALSSGASTRVVYIEPQDYRRRIAPPTEGEIFDLSDAIGGIRPIPGFANFRQVAEADVSFVPLLGFEGGRFLYMVEALQPRGRKIFPVVGVPGFRTDYPFHTWLGNKTPLVNTKAWLDVRYADAACPFSAFHVLEDVTKDQPRDLIKVAPIGTKPHALGAVLFALAFPGRVELVYDHPVRKGSRTAGTDRVHVYLVSRFLDIARM